VQEVHGGLLQEAQQAQHQAAIRRHRPRIIPLLGRKKVQDVKRPDIAGLMEKLAYKPTEANKAFSVLRKMFNLAECGASAGRHQSVPPRPDVPAGKETHLISDEDMGKLFRQLDKIEAKGWRTTSSLAIRLQFEFAGRRSEIVTLEWTGGFENRRVVWPDSKTGGMSKPMSEEAYRLLSTAPRQEGSLRPAVATPPGQHLTTGEYMAAGAALKAAGAARRHARHPPSLDHRHCQFRHPGQGRHGADGAQDRGDVHALRPHRGQAGARGGRTGGEPAQDDHGRAAACGGGGMTRRRSSAASPAAPRRCWATFGH
jgi:hypothetical protein